MSTIASTKRLNGPPQSSPPKISIVWEWVDPLKAQEFLGTNFQKNRAIKERLLRRLCDAISGGYFFPTHQAIAFDQDGNLVDGQHRLTAIVRMSYSTWLLVARGMPREHIEAVDRGSLRKDYDQINMVSDDKVCHIHVSIAKVMHIGILGRSRSPIEFTASPLRNFIARHREAIDFVSAYNCRGVTAPLLGILAKAYYHMDHDELRHFLTVLRDGITSSPRDQPIIKLRDFASDIRNTAGGASSRETLSRKTMAALLAFREHRPLKNLVEVAKDPFPIEGAMVAPCDFQLEGA